MSAWAHLGLSRCSRTLDNELVDIPGMRERHSLFFGRTVLFTGIQHCQISFHEIMQQCMIL